MISGENIKKDHHEKLAHGILIWLDTYDDIFSDFDSREYDHRALSDDFLSEIRKISLEKEGDIREINLLLPISVRNKESEMIIVKRLKQYFKKNHQGLHTMIVAQNKKAALFISIGTLFMLLGGYISYLKPHQLILHLLIIICEPAGWFFVWMGYDLLTNVIARKKNEVSFYNKTAGSDFTFLSIGQEKN